MVLQLSADLEQRIQAQITSGQFRTEEDVVREALDSLERRQVSLGSLQQLVQGAEADVQAGRIGSFDVEQTKRAVRNRLRTQGVND